MRRELWRSICFRILQPDVVLKAFTDPHKDPVDIREEIVTVWEASDTYARRKMLRNLYVEKALFKSCPHKPRDPENRRTDELTFKPPNWSIEIKLAKKSNLRRIYRTSSVSHVVRKATRVLNVLRQYDE